MEYQRDEHRVHEILSGDQLRFPSHEHSLSLEGRVMQIIYVTCRYDCLLSLEQSLEAQFADHDGVMLLDYGFSQKRIDGYIVLAWRKRAEVDQRAFLEQLEALETILDYAVFALPSLDDFPSGTAPTPSRAAKEPYCSV